MHIQGHLLIVQKIYIQYVLQGRHISKCLETGNHCNNFWRWLSEYFFLQEALDTLKGSLLVKDAKYKTFKSPYSEIAKSSSQGYYKLINLF